MICMSIAHALMAFFAVFLTVLKTYEMLCTGFHSKEVFKFVPDTIN